MAAREVRGEIQIREVEELAGQVGMAATREARRRLKHPVRAMAVWEVMEEKRDRIGAEATVARAGMPEELAAIEAGAAMEDAQGKALPPETEGQEVRGFRAERTATSDKHTTGKRSHRLAFMCQSVSRSDSAHDERVYQQGGHRFFSRVFSVGSNKINCLSFLSAQRRGAIRLGV